MVTNSDVRSELLSEARAAFPWFDANRLPQFVEALQEAAYMAGRIQAARQPTLCPGTEREHLLAMAILEAVRQHVQNDATVKVA